MSLLFVRTGANLCMAIEQLPLIPEQQHEETAAPIVTTEYKNLRRLPWTFSLLSTSFFYLTSVERSSSHQDTSHRQLSELLPYTMCGRCGPRDSSDTNPSQEDPLEEPEVRNFEIRDFLPDDSSPSSQHEESDDGAIFGPRTATFTGEGRLRIRRLKREEPSIGLSGGERPRRNSGSETSFAISSVLITSLTRNSERDSSGGDDDSHRYSPSSQDIPDFNHLFLDGRRRHPSRALDDTQNAPSVSRAPHNTPKPQTSVFHQAHQEGKLVLPISPGR